jgi:predicted phage terminase large subunit-like protein
MLEELSGYLHKLDQLSSVEQKEILGLVERIENAARKDRARKHFLGFTKEMWPSFIEGRHHKVMGAAFERVLAGHTKRLIINMPPRHSKSEFASYLLPAWYLGKYPDRKVIQASNTAELAVGFGRRVRNLVNSPEYQDIFPGLGLMADSKAAGRWTTLKAGEYYAIGVGGTVTGKGADLLIIDDPHSEQEATAALGNADIYDKMYEWYTSGPRQRLQPKAAIIVVMTRWHQRDLTARLLRAAAERKGSDRWEVIEFPAILPSGNVLWPEFWSAKELLALKSELPISKWNAQYQQNPTAEEGALIKREWWQKWRKPPPEVEYVLISLDTAYLKHEQADYSACTTWGVFSQTTDDGKRTVQHIILLDAWQERLEFPALKAKVKAYYEKWKPDTVLIEKKAAGAPLVYELRAAGIMVSEFTPTRFNKNKSGTGDKIARVNAVTDIFSSGVVWAPDMPYAEMVIEQCVGFPMAQNDDLVDTVTMALLRLRGGHLLTVPTDEEDDEPMPMKIAAYY